MLYAPKWEQQEKEKEREYNICEGKMLIYCIYNNMPISYDKKGIFAPYKHF
jgi:hypothetical protein